MQPEVSLRDFSPKDFNKGAGKTKQALWYLINALFVRASWNPFIGFKIFMLRIFGAHIGKGVVIKNNVTVKYPWKLEVGDYCWIGENVWIDNLDKVCLGNNVCISQGAMLLTGNHDYNVYNMPYRNAPITIGNGAWVGAKSIVCPGVNIGQNAILTVGSIATKDIEPDGIYQGIPAKQIRKRRLKINNSCKPE